MDEKRRLLLRTIPFFAIGILVFVLYLVFFVNIPEMIGVIQGANVPIYSLAALMAILETLFFALTWQYFLLPLSVKVPFKKIFSFVWIGLFVDLLIPAESVSGELTKTYLMSKEPSANTGKVVASLVSQRMLGTVTTVVTLFVGLLGLLTLDYPISNFMFQILVAITALSVIALAFLAALCVKEKWTERFVNVLMGFVERVSKGRFKLEHFQTRIVEGIRAFYESLRTFGSKPTTLVLPVFFFFLSWLSSVAIVFFVFISIGYSEANMQTLLLKVFVVYALMIAIKSIPIGVPAEVGLPDIIMTTLFILFGIPPDVSAAVTVLSRILTVWFKFFIGFAAAQWVGIKSLMESGVFGRSKNQV